MKKILLLLIITVSISSYSQDDQYAVKLKEMFVVSGTEATYQTTIDQFFQMFKAQYPNVAEETWSGFEKKFNETSIDDLVNLLSPVYQKYLSEDDLDNIIGFYKTPTGKKFAKNTPNITAESIEIGQQWGRMIAESFMEEMKNH